MELNAGKCISYMFDFRFYLEGTIKTGCTMDFSKYPYDRHRCKYIMGSTGYPDTMMKFDSTFSYSESGQRPLQYAVSTGWKSEFCRLSLS